MLRVIDFDRAAAEKDKLFLFLLQSQVLYHNSGLVTVEKEWKETSSWKSYPNLLSVTVLTDRKDPVPIPGDNPCEKDT